MNRLIILFKERNSDPRLVWCALNELITKTSFLLCRRFWKITSSPACGWIATTSFNVTIPWFIAYPKFQTFLFEHIIFFLPWNSRGILYVEHIIVANVSCNLVIWCLLRYSSDFIFLPIALLFASVCWNFVIVLSSYMSRICFISLWWF